MRTGISLFAGGWLIAKGFDNPPSHLNAAITFGLGIMIIFYAVIDMIERRK